MIPLLLRENVPFRRFWLGQTISLFGDEVALIAMPLVAVLTLDAGPAQMGYLTAAALVPNLLFSLHAGAWVDRRGRRRETMLAADVARALLVGSVPLAYLLGVLTIWQLYLVAFLGGTMTVLFGVAYSTLFVSLVRRERYVEGNSLLHGSRALAFVSGPSVGGLLVQAFTGPIALLADACSFLWSAFFLRRIRPEEPPTEEARSGHVVAGLRFIAASPLLRSSLAATAWINFFNLMFFALFVLYATETLDIRPGTLGVVLGAGAVGGLLGSLVTGRLTRRLGVGPAFVLGCFLFPAPLLLVPLAGGPQPLVLAFLFLAEFGAGLGVMILDISVASIFQAAVPDRLRARFSGAYSVVNKGIRPLGSLAGGLLGASIGLRPTLFLATAGAVFGVLFLLRSPARRLVELPEPVA